MSANSHSSRARSRAVQGGFCFSSLKFISSQHVALAFFDEPDELVYRIANDAPIQAIDLRLAQNPFLSEAECQRFHRQLFYWLLKQKDPSMPIRLTRRLDLN